MKAARARLDADRTARPLTVLTAFWMPVKDDGLRHGTVAYPASFIVDNKTGERTFFGRED
jgi:hypothetical protein